MRRTRRSQSGQALVLVAVALLAMIGSAALVLLAGSAEWQKNQLQALADSTAIDSALKIGPTCTGAAATTVITEADTFLATQRTRTGALATAAGTCATPYHGTDTFAGGLSADYYYPYQAHEQQVQVVLTLTLPISFGTAVGKTMGPDFGVLLSGKLSLSAMPDQISIGGGFWRFNPLLTSCVPSTTPTPIPTLVQATPELLRSSKGISDCEQSLLSYSDLA